MPMILYISRIANFVQRIRWFVNANLYIFFNFYIVNILDNNFTKLDKEQHVIKNFSLMHSNQLSGYLQSASQKSIHSHNSSLYCSLILQLAIHLFNPSGQLPPKWRPELKSSGLPNPDLGPTSRPPVPPSDPAP